MLFAQRWLAFCGNMRNNKHMNSKMLLQAGGIGAAAMAYIALLIFHYDIFSIYTLFFGILGGAAGVIIAYKVKFG